MQDPPAPRPRLPPGLAAAVVDAADRAGIGLVVTGEKPEPHHEWVSEMAADLLGYEREALRELPARSFITQPEEPEGSLHESEMQRADGSRIPVRLVSVENRLGDNSAIIDFFFDTLHRQRALGELESSEQRFRQVIEAAPDAIGIAVDSTLVYANVALARLLGMDRVDGLVGRTLRDTLHPDDMILARQRMQAVRSGRVLPPTEYRLRRNDGSYANVELVSMAAEWDGQPAVIGMMRDLSERKQTQAQLIQSDRLTALGTLAAGVAHEINNPLAYVLLNLQYLIRELPKLRDEARIEQLLARLKEAEHGAERVSTIVRDLKAFSRPEEEQVGPVDLSRVLASATKVAKSLVDERARLVEDYERPPPVVGNAARLEQVFLNLLINAAQALPTGQAETNEVRVSLSYDRSTVTVRVSDTGPGIAPELLDRVFDPFFTTKPAGTGTGLGLPICHSIVTSLGGKISVDSEVGRGTTFRVELPASHAPPLRRSYTPTPITAVALPRASVLVIDDELPVASMLKRVLGDEHDVQVTTSAREALEKMSSEDFDVVLCDLLMPGVSGMDLYRELAKQRPGAEQRVVFMTGGAFTPRAAEFLESVPNERLEKPFDLNAVRHLVRKLASR